MFCKDKRRRAPAAARDSMMERRFCLLAAKNRLCFKFRKRFSKNEIRAYSIAA
jgi:hypothetical protein